MAGVGGKSCLELKVNLGTQSQHIVNLLLLIVHMFIKNSWNVDRQLCGFRIIPVQSLKLPFPTMIPPLTFHVLAAAHKLGLVTANVNLSCNVQSHMCDKSWVHWFNIASLSRPATCEQQGHVCGGSDLGRSRRKGTPKRQTKCMVHLTSFKSNFIMINRKMLQTQVLFPTSCLTNFVL